MCKGGSFVKYHGLKKKATVGWKSGGYVGVRQDWAHGERSPGIITNYYLRPGLLVLIVFCAKF
jgi:hypothetical protein